MQKKVEAIANLFDLYKCHLKIIIYLNAINFFLLVKIYILSNFSSSLIFSMEPLVVSRSSGRYK